MAEIRQVSIKNFRSIKELLWYPKPGLNCLIGPGDSGKSTILDAIDLTLTIRRSYSFSDSDFYKLQTEKDIEIMVSLGSLDQELMDMEVYGNFLRSLNNSNGQITDEPVHGQETILTIKLTVKENLEPDWTLYSQRAESQGLERCLLWRHRELVVPARLGVISHYHLAWGKQSILNKLSDEVLNTSATFAAIGRQAREYFSGENLNVQDTLNKVKNTADRLGVSTGNLKALLDVNGVSLSNGAISVHNEDNTPLRQLGTGSSRLLISGLQKEANKSKIFIVDEAEYGLEPYRITRLLNELGSKNNIPVKQVIISTHSPYVLRELQAHQLHVVRKLIDPQPPHNHLSHWIYSLFNEDELQATIRACAEAFFSKGVIVCEGRTEVGLIKGLDIHFEENGGHGIHSQGVSCTDGGGGDKYFKRAKIFRNLGYRTSILQDSDISDQTHIDKANECRTLGIEVYEWGNGYSTEMALFNCCKLESMSKIVKVAEDFYGSDIIDQHIKNMSNNLYSLDDVHTSPSEALRSILSNASGKYKWFKDITKSELLSNKVIAPCLNNYTDPFSTVLSNIFNWSRTVGNN